MNKEIRWDNNSGYVFQDDTYHKVFWYDHLESGNYLLFLNIEVFNDLRKKPLKIGWDSGKGICDPTINRYASLEDLKEGAEYFLRNYKVYLNEEDKKKIAIKLNKMQSIFQPPEWCRWLAIDENGVIGAFRRKPVLDESEGIWICKGLSVMYPPTEVTVGGKVTDLSVPWTKTCITFKEISPYIPDPKSYKFWEKDSELYEY